jgi:hypothetical protein
VNRPEPDHDGLAVWRRRECSPSYLLVSEGGLELPVVGNRPRQAHSDSSRRTRVRFPPRTGRGPGEMPAPLLRNAWAAADSGGPGIRRLRALSAEERVGAESIPMTCRRALGARRRYCRPLLFIASAMRSDRQGDLSSDCRGTGTRSNAHGRLGRGRGRRRSRQTSPVDSGVTHPGQRSVADQPVSSKFCVLRPSNRKLVACAPVTQVSCIHAARQW